MRYAVAGSGSNAANGVDFAGGALPSGWLTFVAGQTSQTLTANVRGDLTVEPDEGFTVTLSDPVGAALGTATASGVIQNDDSTSVSIVALDADKPEGLTGSTPFTFTVSLTNPSSTPVTVTYAVAGVVGAMRRTVWTLSAGRCPAVC